MASETFVTADLNVVFSFAFAFAAGLYCLIVWWWWGMQLCVNHKDSSVISCSEPLHERFGWIWLGVAVIEPREIKGLLTNIFQK